MTEKVPARRWKPVDIVTNHVITNGKPHPETYEAIKNVGAVILHEGPAKEFHPKAMPTDIIVFYAKPIDTQEYDEWLKSEEYYSNVDRPDYDAQPNPPGDRGNA